MCKFRSNINSIGNNIYYYSITFILFITITLQSCGHSNGPSTSDFQDISTNNNLEAPKKSKINPLLNTQFTAEGGYLVAFHGYGTELRADVTVPLLNKTYTDLPVRLAQGINLSHLPRLHKVSQKKMLHFRMPTKGCLGQVCVIKDGILGGMLEGDDYQEQGQFIQQLSDMDELGEYFREDYLLFTPYNCEILVEKSKEHELLFGNYNGGILVTGWEIPDGFDVLTELLQSFTKIKLFKVECKIEDRAGIAEVIARAVQFYEDMIELDLSCCLLSDVDVADIIESVKCPEKIRFLAINDNCLSKEFIVTLQEKFTHVQVYGLEEATTVEEIFEKEEEIEKDLDFYTLLLGYAKLKKDKDIFYLLGLRDYKLWEEEFVSDYLTQAIENLRAAVEQGHLEAEMLLEEILNKTANGKEKIEEKEKEKEKEEDINIDLNIYRLLSQHARLKTDKDAFYLLGLRAYGLWKKNFMPTAVDEAIENLRAAVKQGHMQAEILLGHLSNEMVIGKQKTEEKEEENNLSEELQKRIISQLSQPAYYQCIKLNLFKYLSTDVLSSDQKEKLTDLLRLIVAPERKLRLGADREIREAFRMNPSERHALFAPLLIDLTKFINSKQEFIGTPVEALLEELISKYKEFNKMLTAKVQEQGYAAPLSLFRAKGLLQGEGFGCYEVGIDKAYQLACYNPQEYEYVKYNNSGNSIGKMHKGVYFKVDNHNHLLRPAKEQAVYTFYQALGLKAILSPTHLIVINGLGILPGDTGECPQRRELNQKKNSLVEQLGRNVSSQDAFDHYPGLEHTIHSAHQEHPIFIQASLEASGKTLKQWLEEAENNNSLFDLLDKKSFSGHVLASLLLIPTDYKPDNLVVDKQGKIIGIDNDAALDSYELEKQLDGSYQVKVRNILYTLPLMEFTVDADIREQFLNHHPGIFLLNWLESLLPQEKNYNNFLAAAVLDTKVPEQFEKNAKESLDLPLQFIPGWIAAMHERFLKIQAELRKNPNITHQDLFDKIHPFASRYYHALAKRYSKPLDQLAFIYQNITRLSVEDIEANGFETVIAQYPKLGDEELLETLSKTLCFVNQVPKLTIEQAIQELIGDSTCFEYYDFTQKEAWQDRILQLDENLLNTLSSMQLKDDVEKEESDRRGQDSFRGSLNNSVYSFLSSPDSVFEQYLRTNSLGV